MGQAEKNFWPPKEVEFIISAQSILLALDVDPVSLYKPPLLIVAKAIVEL